MKFKSLSRKLVTGFLSVIILLIVVGGIGLYSVVEMNSKYSFMLDDSVKKVDLVDELISIKRNMAMDINNYLIYKEQRYMNQVKENDERFMDVYEELEHMLTRVDDSEMLSNILSEHEQYDQAVEMINKSFIAQDQEEMVFNTRYSNRILVLFMRKTEELKETQYEEMVQMRQELDKLANITYVLIVSVSVIALFISGLIAYFISRSITRPVKVMTDALDHFANGNLQIEELKIRSHDEIGLMAQAFNKMTQDLRGVVTNISDSAIQLSAQSEELSASSEESTASSEMVATGAEKNLKGSEEQLVIVEQTVASMDKMVSGLQQITESNEEVSRATGLVSSLVDQGSVAFSDVSIQMNEIRSTIQSTAMTMQVLEENSSKIQRVTALITAISEQTNLLSLNAAIEAARAGEHGKGFAVVAEEVRNLAVQSKESASEIEGMIKFIQSDAISAADSIRLGSDKVDQGLETLQTSLKIFDQIEEATHGTSSSVQTVSTAIAEIQKMTDDVIAGSSAAQKLAEMAASSAQETSVATDEQLATMQEIASSIQSLASLAENLQLEVSKFKV